MKLLERLRGTNRKEQPEVASSPGVPTDEQSVQALEDGIPSLHDLIAPGGFDRSHPDVMKVGPFFVKSMTVTGLPSEIGVGWLTPFLSHEGHLDLSIHIAPFDDRAALGSLTLLITKLRAKLRFKGHLQGISDDLARAIQDAERIRDLVASNKSRLFRMTAVASLYDRDEQRLRDAATLIDGRLAGRRIYGKFLEARQDEAYQSVLPFGVNYVNDVYRTLDTYGLGTVLPFTDSDLVHRGGYQFAINMRTGSPIIYNPYDKGLPNHNIICYAGSGAGKSATVKTMIGRAIFTGERTAVLDPEGEYGYAAEVLGGVQIPLGPGSIYKLNPFDVIPETDPDTGAVSVKLTDKVLALLDLVGTMVGGMSAEEQAVVEVSLRQVYKDFGISADPESLYERGPSMPDPDRPGLFKFGRQPRKMPQLSNLVEVLRTHEGARRVVASLGPYYGEGVLSFFDCQSTVTVDNQWLTVFDLSLLDERLGKPVALQVALTWLWESFVKKNPTQKKRVVVDEAWLMADFEPAMRFLENCVRRARKRSAGLTVISQDFRKFSQHPRGPAIHSNSGTLILLRCEEVDLPQIQETFHLSDGERNFIGTCGKGSGVLRVKGRPFAFQVVHTDSEKSWVYTTPIKAEA